MIFFKGIQFTIGLYSLWKRYVDDSFVINKKDAVASSHGNTLNASYPKTRKQSCQIAFLGTLVSRGNGVAVIAVYRKPTHADRYLDFSSHDEIKDKISTA